MWPLPPAEVSLAPGQVHVWSCNLDCSPAKLESLRRVLSSDEVTRSEGYYFTDDKHRFMAGRGILRNILGYYLKVDPASLKFNYSSHGKPGLAGQNTVEPGLLKFNFTHSKNLALLAVTSNYRIGIDLEYLNESLSLSELVTRFFAPGEIIEFNKLAPAQQPAAFYNAWTRKEAYMKACGEGLSAGIGNVEVSFVPGQPAGILKISNDQQAAACWSLEALYPEPGFVAALAIEAHNTSLKCWSWLKEAT